MRPTVLFVAAIALVGAACGLVSPVTPTPPLSDVARRTTDSDELAGTLGPAIPSSRNMSASLFARGYDAIVAEVTDDRLGVVFQSGASSTVSLLGVSIRDTWGRGTMDAECMKGWSRRAVEFVEATLTGRMVTVVLDQAGTLGAISTAPLVYVHLGREDFGAQLLRLGYAQVTPEGKFRRRTEYSRLEDEARRQRSGLWECQEQRAQTRALEADVLRVIDGDTVVVRLVVSGQVRSVRLMGLDVPGVSIANGPLWLPDTPCLYYWAEQATNYVARQLSGRTVTLLAYPSWGEQGNDRIDGDGPLLAYVSVGGEDFNASLIRKGFARAYPELDPGQAADYRGHEEWARARGLGLWECYP